ncbi:BTB/POZ domain-containing protein At1g55760-like [Trifolium pratense]|nr:BTB/POZ domain-containing protein At1g55760-like [Trifolium pratense]
MNDYAYKVERMNRLIQWRVHNLSTCTYMKADPFKIAMWNWHLSIEKNCGLRIELYPEISKENSYPIASFIISIYGGNSKILTQSEIKDKVLSNKDCFVWEIEVPLPGKFIIDIEFLDLKTTCTKGGEACSIWSNGFIQKIQNATALESLGRMIREGIYTDITINVNSEGSIKAHRAILASQSPVFRSMFSHNVKETDLSTINIEDMSIEACQTFINFLYGTVNDDEFLMHRLDLLHAADKYDIYDLREACEKSLQEDIDAKNVLERLQLASFYRLTKLKISCMQYLVKFGKIYDVQGDLTTFLQTADRDLICEVFHEILDACKK